MTRTPWFERKFTFDLPVGLFPVIVERLRGTAARMEDMVSTFPAEVLTVRVNDRWSIQEHVGHLLDLEELHDGRIDDYLARAETLRPADTKNEKTYKANHNANSVGNLIAAFRMSRGYFVRRLENLDHETIAFASVHPRLKQPMRVVDFAFFVAEHDDHHLATMRELSRVLKK